MKTLQIPFTQEDANYLSGIGENFDPSTQYGCDRNYRFLLPKGYSPEITAVGSGTVVHSRGERTPHEAYAGSDIVLQFEDGIRIFYKNAIPLVQTGKTVKAGEVIGRFDMESGNHTKEANALFLSTYIGNGKPDGIKPHDTLLQLRPYEALETEELSLC